MNARTSRDLLSTKNVFEDFLINVYEITYKEIGIKLEEN